MSSPQQRAAQTMRDRRQLAAIADEQDDLRKEIRDLEACMHRLMDLQENQLRLVRQVAHDVYVRGWGVPEEVREPVADLRQVQPELTVIVNDTAPRPSRRRPPQLRLAGDGQ